MNFDRIQNLLRPVVVRTTRPRTPSQEHKDIHVLAWASAVDVMLESIKVCHVLSLRPVSAPPRPKDLIFAYGVDKVQGSILPQFQQELQRGKYLAAGTETYVQLGKTLLQKTHLMWVCSTEPATVILEYVLGDGQRVRIELLTSPHLPV
jgi:hypothetical protein